MASNKTQQTEADVFNFIEKTATPQQQEDSFTLIKIMQNITGEPPKMWGPSIIGFGTYHYVYASGHSGDAPLLGFSPRKAAISLYVYDCNQEGSNYLQDLGKYKMGKACIYVKKLNDINLDILEKLMLESIAFVNKTYGKQ